MGESFPNNNMSQLSFLSFSFLSLFWLEKNKIK